MNIDQKVQALNNGLRSFGFPEKYFIHGVGQEGRDVFCIMSKSEVGGYDQHTSFFTYERMNYFLMGYNAALTKPLF